MTHAEPATATGAVAPSATEVGSVFVANYPPFSAWSPAALGRFAAVLDEPPLPQTPGTPGTPLGLYLHVPFCRKRCKFCYFRVYTDKDSSEIGAYLDALATEVELYAERRAVAGRPLEFVYFGGGTPSYLSVRQLKGLVARLEQAIPWKGAREITFECEPGTLTQSKLEAIRAIGVTRLSLGIESWNDEVLKENGRAHVSTEIYRVLPWIAELGFDQLNVDLIAGMVGETWESWQENVERTLAIAPDSVTVYQMELPYNTVYSQDVLGGTFAQPLADWPTKRAWHEYAFARLAEAGYVLSSAYTMVKPGGRFVYRDLVWHGCDLLGTGVASFGHLSGVHYQNVASWGEYLAPLAERRLPLGRAYETSARERLTRETILQLKLGRLELGGLAAKFGVDPLEAFAPAWERLAGRGMLRLDGDAVELTPSGLMQVDRLLPELYDQRFQNARYT